MVRYRAARTIHQPLRIWVHNDQSARFVSIEPLCQLRVDPFISKAVPTTNQRIHLAEDFVEVAVKIGEDAGSVLVHLVEGTNEQFGPTRCVIEVLCQGNADATP